MPFSSSAVDSSLPPLTPSFSPDGSHPESGYTQAVINKLGFQFHEEGGYFVETDRAKLRVPNPFALRSRGSPISADLLVSNRSASTTIHYLLTPKSPLGAFHRNKGRTVHTLHRGRGRYVVIHADEVADASYPGGYAEDVTAALGEEMRWTGKARVETFVVGPNILAGERMQWIVDGGKYKASLLLPDDEEGNDSEGLLISETVIPGFEWDDHDFLRATRLEALVTYEQNNELKWMLRKTAGQYEGIDGA